MIWYSKDVIITNQPEDTQSKVVAYYNPPMDDPSKPLITIELVVSDRRGNSVVKQLYSHNPKMMLHEDPDKTDIMIKYATNLEKSIRKATTYDFLLLFPST